VKRTDTITTLNVVYAFSNPGGTGTPN
jgi:hypothetical protein